MRSSRSSNLTLVAVATLCLAVGGVGSASASGLTKGAVKKIAAQVVDREASSLSVLHATSADSATTATTASQLGGFTASQLRTSGYRYTLPIQDFKNGRNYSFPGLPMGTYLATYAIAGGTTGLTDPVICQFVVGSTTYGADEEVAASHFFTLGGTDSFTVTATPIWLSCTTPTGYKLNLSYGNVVTFLPIDLPTTAVATAP